MTILDLNNFGPLHSEVWGPVSDYIILFVSVLGTWFVIKSFRAQQVINLQQSEINRLAMEKDRREIRPYFKIGFSDSFNMTDTIMIVTLHNAPAFQVIFEYAKDGRFHVEQNVLLQSEWEIGSSMQIRVSKNPPERNKSDSISIVEIKFKDEALRSYSQSVSYDESRANITIPLLIQEYNIWKLN